MKQWRSRAVMIVASMSVAVVLSGCAVLGGAVVAAGVGTYYWAKGELTRVYAANYDSTWQAVLDTGKELDLRLDRYTRDKLGGEIAFIRGDGEEVVVRVRSLKEDLTEIGVRIGTFGDRVASERIHYTVYRTLKDKGQIKTGA